MLYHGTKVRKMRFILEMHFFLDSAAYRIFLDNCCAYTPTRIPTNPTWVSDCEIRQNHSTRWDGLRPVAASQGASRRL